MRISSWSAIGSVVVVTAIVVGIGACVVGAVVSGTGALATTVVAAAVAGRGPSVVVEIVRLVVLGSSTVEELALTARVARRRDVTADAHRRRRRRHGGSSGVRMTDIVADILVAATSADGDHTLLEQPTWPQTRLAPVFDEPLAPERVRRTPRPTSAVKKPASVT